MPKKKKIQRKSIDKTKTIPKPKASIEELQESRNGGQIALRGYSYQFLYSCYLMLSCKDENTVFNFNPLPTGVCLYDFRRGNCTDGDGCFFYNCPNYITEVQFYPILKDELDLLEKEMARLKELGHEREWQKQYIKYKYLKPLVESLEVQLNGKESVG